MKLRFDTQWIRKLREQNRGARILVVEDDPDTLREIARSFRRGGYEVEEASSGYEGLKRARHHPPELVLWNENLPDPNGLAAGGQIKLSPELSGIPVLYHSTGEVDGSGRLQEPDFGEEASASSSVLSDDLFAPAEVLIRLNRLEEQSRQAQKMESIGHIASGVAHDFNNILGAILGNVELARADVGQDHPAWESLEEIKKAGHRAKNLVRQILTLTRQQPEERRVISLGSLIEEVASLLRVTLPAGLDFVKSIAADAPNVLADSTQIHQVLINLCTNAWHALEGQHGRIEVKLEAVTLDADAAGRLAGLRPGRYACLSVSDTGKGMDAATLERIFDPFFTTKESGKGTGLGLSMVHGIVQRHEGAISLISQSGSGTTFYLYFPAVQALAEGPPASEVTAVRGAGQRILLVDDDEHMVFLCKRTLERFGYEVDGFMRPSEALTAFCENPGQFDLVITDLNMLGWSGLHLASEILRRRSNVPVVLCSGYVTDETMQQARRIGIQHILYKPSTADELSAAIHKLISGTCKSHPG